MASLQDDKKKHGDVDRESQAGSVGSNRELVSEPQATVEATKEGPKEGWEMWKERIDAYIESNIWVAFMTAVTFVVLFLGDFKYLLMPFSADWWVNLFNTIALILFTLELVASSVAKKGYFNGFFFWLDLVATASLIFEIDWIFLRIIQVDSEQSADTAKTISQVSSASRVTRVLRIIRVIRLIRIVKLYKSAVQARKNREMQQKKQEEEKFKLINAQTSQVRNTKRGSAVTRRKSSRAPTDLLASPTKKVQKKVTVKKEEKQEDVVVNENKINKIISESITKKVIILIMSMLFFMPILSDEFYASDSDDNYQILSEYVAYYTKEENKAQGYPSQEFLFDWVRAEQVDNFPVVKVQLNDVIVYSNPDEVTLDFRYDELKYYESGDGRVITAVNVTYETKFDAFMNILKTLFTCFVLTFFALVFEKDTKRLVLDPLSVIMEIVDKVAKDPINAQNTEELQAGLLSTMTKMAGKGNKKASKDENYEVVIIQSAILKISAMLAIGFGEAGGEIIRTNIQSQDGLNPMISGKKTHCIFGFCDIRGFPTVNEAIQERTMVFVNEISETVHSIVDRFKGAANKNIGDAFLCAWKFRDSKGEECEPTPEEHSCVDLADHALLGFMTVFREINCRREILKYKEEPAIQEKLKNYKVNMGFGLHLGWGIEGAIGSTYKIDCSYLSPNVNISARLEAATRQYGVSLLISGELYDMLSPGMKDLCRCIDVVAVKGSNKPIALYTVDMKTELRERKSMNLISQKAKKKYFALRKRKLEADVKSCSDVLDYVDKIGDYADLFDCPQNTQEFTSAWEEGFLNYKNGDWQKSREMLMKCKEICNDGPANTLLNFMSEKSFTAPSNWEHFRALTSK